MEKCFLGYRSIALKPGELITSVEFELLSKAETLALYKVSQRKDLDISGVNAAFRACFKSVGGKFVIDRMSIALGGVAATPVRLAKTEASLKGMVLGAEALAQASQTLQKEIAPISDLRGSQAFRRVGREPASQIFQGEGSRMTKPYPERAGHRPGLPDPLPSSYGVLSRQKRWKESRIRRTKRVATIEHIIEQIAQVVGKDPLDIRKLNCYTADGARDITPMLSSSFTAMGRSRSPRAQPKWARA
jgi:hypothetical protein